MRGSSRQRLTGPLLCFRCLTPGHLVRECANALRCKTCLLYRHRARAYINRRLGVKQVWQRRTQTQSEGINSSPIEARAKERTVQSDPSLHAQCTAPIDQSASSPSVPSTPKQGAESSSSSSAHHRPTLLSEQEAEQVAAAIAKSTAAMANFAINPTRFIPHGLETQDGGEQRLQRIVTHLPGAFRRRHEEYAIAITDAMLPPHQAANLMYATRDYIEGEMHLQVRSFCRHPDGIGLFQLTSPLRRA